MYRFFNPVIRPLLDAARPSVVIEIGSDKGLATAHLLEWCSENDAVLHCVDPLPKYDVDEWKQRWSDTLQFHRDLSLNTLVDIGPADFVCIDGDHNWYTVYHELETLGSTNSTAGEPFPVVLLHDVGWPYGRRDLYYDPDTIPDAFRHDHRRGGLKPGESGLAEHGFNDHLENAVREGTPRNGVLTAAEDYVSEHADLQLRVIPGLNGLGMIVDARLEADILEAVDEIMSRSGLNRVLEAVETDRILRLDEAWKFRRDLHTLSGQLERVQKEVAHRLEQIEKAKAAQQELRARLQLSRSKLDDHRRELNRQRSAVKKADALRKAAEARASRAEKAHQDSVAQHREALSALKGQLEHRKYELDRLKSRRSVRFALGIARLTRPVFRLRRGQVGSQESADVPATIDEPENPDRSRPLSGRPIHTDRERT